MAKPEALKTKVSMELILNGKTADISDFEADELAQAVLISLFHGVNRLQMMVR